VGNFEETYQGRSISDREFYAAQQRRSLATGVALFHSSSALQYAIGYRDDPFGKLACLAFNVGDMLLAEYYANKER
jgi:hypothetical protein